MYDTDNRGTTLLRRIERKMNTYGDEKIVGLVRAAQPLCESAALQHLHSPALQLQL